MFATDRQLIIKTIIIDIDDFGNQNCSMAIPESVERPATRMRPD